MAFVRAEVRPKRAGFPISSSAIVAPPRAQTCADHIESPTGKFQNRPGSDESHVTPCLLPNARSENSNQCNTEANGEEDVDSDIRIVAQRGQLHGAEVADLLARLVRLVMCAVVRHRDRDPSCAHSFPVFLIIATSNQAVCQAFGPFLK